VMSRWALVGLLSDEQVVGLLSDEQVGTGRPAE